MPPLHLGVTTAHHPRTATALALGHDDPMPPHLSLRDRPPALWAVAILALWATPSPWTTTSAGAAGETDPGGGAWPLIRDLGSGSIAAREEAERRLLALGPAALPDVAAARTLAAGEAAFRLDGIQRQLERQATEQAIEASIVSFDWRDVPARRCLAEVLARTRNEIPLDDDLARAAAGSTPVTERIERATFWETVDGLLDRAGLELATGPEPPGLRIIAAATPGHGRQPAVASGPFRISVARVEPVGLATGQPEAPRGSRIVLRVAWEPRLEPFLVRLSTRTIVAEGPAGESVAPAQRAATLEAAVAHRRAWVEMPVQLSRPETPLASLGMLRGTLAVWLAGMEQTFVFSAGRPPDAVRIADAEVRLLEVAQRPEGLLVRMRVTYGSPSEALASHQTWLQDRRVVAALADGRQLERLEHRVEARDDRGLTAAVVFAVPPPGGDGAPSPSGRLPPVTLSWRLPSAIHEVPVDFALRAIDLETTKNR